MSYKVDRNIGAGPIAQRLEQATHNRLVGGSNPSGPTNLAGVEKQRLIVEQRVLVALFVSVTLLCMVQETRENMRLSAV